MLCCTFLCNFGKTRRQCNRASIQSSTLNFQACSGFRETKIVEPCQYMKKKKHWMNCDRKWKKISFCHGSNKAGWKHYYVKILLFVTIVSWQFSTVAFMRVLLGTTEDVWFVLKYKAGDLFTDPHCSVAKWKMLTCQPELLFSKLLRESLAGLDCRPFFILVLNIKYSPSKGFLISFAPVYIT